MERKLTEVMTLPLAETADKTLSLSSYKKIKTFLGRVDVVAIGPGLSQNSSTKKLIQRLIRTLKKPFVLDADGINAFIGKTKLLKESDKHSVITPHPGEMARLLGKSVNFVQKNRFAIAKKFAVEYTKTVVLKGHKTVVASPDGSHYINTTGNPGMASGGTGDCLTGIIASLIGQGIESFKAACLGTYVHGLAGDLAVKEKGEMSLVATDLLKKLPAAFKKATPG
jgi:NAD(P)H-hydrate epimerase